MLTIGELFSGIGGASLAVHAVIPGSVTLWQSDLVNEKVRARHFPDAQQLVGDVCALDPSRMPRVDLLTAGFPCTDLSVAGKQAGLDGARSGLYSEVLRFAAAMRPGRVLIENVPALLTYIPRLCADFRALGYGLTWTVCEAADAGLPHLRRRVFVLAELDVRGRGPVDVDHSARWQPENLRVWPTPTVCGNDNREGASPTSGDGLGTAVRLWATPTAANPNETEDPAQWEARRTLAAAKHGTNGIGEPLGQQARLWASPRASDADRGSDPDRVSGGKGGIVGQVRLWATATATATDFKTPAGFVRQGHPPSRIGEQLFAEQGKRLSPAWVEALMGYPVGWTEPEGDPLPHVFPPPVRGRYPAEWDRSVPWPGFDWEPSRTLPDGPKAHGRAARLKALGNSWVPAQGALALRALLGEGRQLSLL